MSCLSLRPVLYFWSILWIEGVISQDMKSHVIQPNGGFQWENCGFPMTPIIVESFQITPDPVITNRAVIMSVAVNFTQDIGVKGQHLMIGGSIKIKVGDWYKDICDLMDFSCHIEDICNYLVSMKICPPSLHQTFKCQCPIPAGIYEFKLPVPMLKTGFEIHGSFEIVVAIKDDNSMLGCLSFRFCVTRCSP